MSIHIATHSSTSKMATKLPVWYMKIYGFNNSQRLDYRDA